jgi:hypothetical protein
MSKLNLSQYRNAMFANRGTDINDALDYALRMTTGNPEGLTAVYVVLNTVINAVEADARVATRWGELLSTDTPPAAVEPVATAAVISAAVRSWLDDHAGDMVGDWCLENAGECVTDWCLENAGERVSDWCSDNASDTVDSWLENNANDMITDMVTDQVDRMNFTVTATRKSER